MTAVCDDQRYRNVCAYCMNRACMQYDGRLWLRAYDTWPLRLGTNAMLKMAAGPSFLDIWQDL